MKRAKQEGAFSSRKWFCQDQVISISSNQTHNLQQRSELLLICLTTHGSTSLLLIIKPFFKHSYKPGRRLSIMVENIAPCTRLFVLVCAAVMLFVMCPDAARASPITIQVDNEVKHKVRRRLYTPKSQHHQLFTGQLSPETGLQSGPPSNTKTIWHYRKAPSIIDHQPKPLGFTEGSFGYNQNSPDNRQSYAGMTRVQSEMLPANSMSTSNNPHVGENVQGLKSSENYHPTNGNLYNSYPAIIRRASYKDPASPYFQSSSRSVVRNPSIAQKSYQKENAGSGYSAC
ncbi:uncharacterized protein LOC132958914 [Labrus mixtus]|uniref:uncharacterized protein LOC132958914 n=1 Tax=Labrus mixtus TaxID=508554 RepID=UPI0029C0C56D|nr:uncharacterized protein LOC132958914 [Labrus mixtus]